MKGVSRRRLAALGAAGLAAGFLGRLVWTEARASVPELPAQGLRLSDLFTPADAKMAVRFLSWFRGRATGKDRAIRNLVFNFYDLEAGKGAWVYPMLSGKAMLWLIRRGLVDEASAIGTTLLRWQQTSRQGPLAKCYGAFSSKLEEKDGKYQHGERYYSGDNLMILEALLALHAKTKNPELLNAAIGVGTWLTEVMCKGKAFGVWTEDHGAPMQFVSSAGNFSNTIHTGMEMLWMRSLQQLGKLTSEPAYSRQAQRAHEFLRRCQTTSGAYLEAYDPGYPAFPYNAGRWKPYQPGQVIGDNMLRTALGACRLGDLDSARKFHRYLKVENGAIPAYLNVDTGEHGFPKGSPVYYDVTSSALHRSLCQWLSQRAAAETDMAFLRATQHPSGGWPWGIFKNGLKPVEPKLAPIVGFWATDDLSRITA
jgi:hypothetical protein